MLDGRALDRTVAAEDAAIAGQRPQQRLARLALMEEQASVRRHLELCRMTAFRAGKDRAGLDASPSGRWRHLREYVMEPERFAPEFKKRGVRMIQATTTRSAHARWPTSRPPGPGESPSRCKRATTDSTSTGATWQRTRRHHSTGWMDIRAPYGLPDARAATKSRVWHSIQFAIPRTMTSE